MPFTFTNFQPLPPEQASPLSAAISGLLSGVNAGPGFRKSMTEAKYAPQSIQADIFGKEFAPLAAIASSPLAQSMIGQTGTNQLFEMISKLLQQNISSFGGQSSGQPGMQQGSQGNQPLQNQNNQPMTDQGGSNNPNMPTNSPNTNGGGDQQHTNGQLNPALANAAGGIGSELAQKALASATEQLHAPGTTFFDPKDPSKTYSQSGPGLIETSQQGFAAIRSALPQMQDIIKKSPEFLNPGSDLTTNASQISGWLARHDPTALLHMGEGGQGYVTQYAKKSGIDPEKISRYNDWNQERFQTGEMFKRAYPSLATSDKAMQLVTEGLTPSPGETTKGFQKRMYSSMARAIQLADQDQQNIREAIPLNQPLQPPPGAQQNRQSANIPPPSNQNSYSYGANGQNITGNPQDVIDNYNKKNTKTTPNAISNQLKNVSKPDLSSPEFTYGEGKEPPHGYFWARTPEGDIVPVLNYKKDKALKLKLKEVA